MAWGWGLGIPKPLILTMWLETLDNLSLRGVGGQALTAGSGHDATRARIMRPVFQADKTPGGWGEVALIVRIHGAALSGRGNEWQLRIRPSLSMRGKPIVLIAPRKVFSQTSKIGEKAALIDARSV